jgi:predicted transcriptional regulator
MLENPVPKSEIHGETAYTPPPDQRAPVRWDARVQRSRHSGEEPGAVQLRYDLPSWEVGMQGLGELEAAVMDVLWQTEEPVKVRDVLDRLDTGKSLAYTTVMTVLDNLFRKDWVERELHGKAYLYKPMLSREEAAARALREVLDASGDPEGVLMHFAATVSEKESAVLNTVLRKKRARRR